jgi:diguanylate cyclase (GGDEF)-like protein
LNAPFPPPENELAAPLKSLYSSLKHLTWQSTQVAKGDYSQHVDFMGEFSDAFNSMIKQLSDRQEQLINEIELTRKKNAALEAGNDLLSNITENIPQQIIVTDIETNEILFLNNSAKNHEYENKGYIEKLLGIINEHKNLFKGKNEEIQFIQNDATHYLSVSYYQLEWRNKNAGAFVIQDISEEKNRILELENHAYRDSMTKLFNRFAGMMTLNEWMAEKRKFALIFVDLDSLKRVNDEFGHTEGDRYIMSAATRLTEISPDVIACRIGGDEFMVIIPEVDFDEAESLMQASYNRLTGDEYLIGKDFEYHFSFGIVDVASDNEQSASEILSIADERMYTNKQANKKRRQEKAYR